MRIIERGRSRLRINVSRTAFLKAIDAALADAAEKGAVIQFINENGGRIELQQLGLLFKRLGLNRTDSIALMEDIGIAAQEAALALQACCELRIGVDK
ncbi:MAG: hypothetical protein LVQ97_03260 [Candidatus Micrarchaeales archaeon]|jgi:hypothetical protein|uniref:Uncharacterized protein n=1 Tax=Candidatus Micrarchaeum acidiphilum ARMAN-2 TaxID=425595 RepID=C7DG83_MICA2|nr:MAG: hypothetical protein UNLARM2_0087 [Candidatus Micrarchaeum acidiphilum ARMAN-2]MCW6161178.1 hypothetical protein [Candidatus Micrarchaeales archaeon]